MSFNSFVSKISIIIKNNIKLYLTIITTVALFYIYLLISIIITNTLNKRPDPILQNLGTNHLFLISIFITIIIYFPMPLINRRTNRNDTILKYLKRIYYYYPVLPLFMISVGFLLMTLLNPNPLMTFGSILFISGLFLFYIMFLIKTHCESKIYYTLHKASEILSEFNVNDKKFKKINKYFIKFINNLDRNLNRGIKINDMKKERNYSSESTIDVPIKNAIIYYFPVFIKFGNKEQISSLTNHINKMLTLVNKNDEFDIAISNVILDIHKDIQNFLDFNNFLITEHRWQIKLFGLNKDFLAVTGLVVYKLVEFFISLYSK